MNIQEYAKLRQDAIHGQDPAVKAAYRVAWQEQEAAVAAIKVPWQPRATAPWYIPVIVKWRFWNSWDEHHYHEIRIATLTAEGWVVDLDSAPTRDEDPVESEISYGEGIVGWIPLPADVSRANKPC